MRIELDDYSDSFLPSASAEGAVAIESSCHAPGPRKEPFIREAARILAPGGRLVVADGFLKHPEKPLSPMWDRLHASLCRSFVIPELAQIEGFVEALADHGFTDIVVEEISWRVAPSALHAPLMVLWFRLQRMRRQKPIGVQSANNLRGSLLSAVLGMNRWKFGYFLVSATRSAGAHSGDGNDCGPVRAV